MNPARGKWTMTSPACSSLRMIEMRSLVRPSKVSRMSSSSGSALGSVNAIAAFSSSKDQNYLATVIGFRGDAVAASSGEAPDWNGTATASSSTSGSSSGASSSGAVLSPGISPGSALSSSSGIGGSSGGS